MGICKRCGKHFTPDKFHPYQQYCGSNCKNEAWRKKRLNELRPAVIEILGGKCVACNTGDIFLLEIDHINNDGHKDKRFKLKLGFYSWIIKNPEKARDKYRVLCSNHHHLKHRFPEEFEIRYPNIKVK